MLQIIPDWGYDLQLSQIKSSVRKLPENRSDIADQYNNLDKTANQIPAL